MAVSTLLPELGLHPWLFHVAPKNWFETVDRRRAYVDWLKIKVGISELSELKESHFLENHGAGLLAAVGGSVEGVLSSLSDLSSLKPSEVQV